jgi:ribose 5-phosphate isomerase A
MLPVEVATFAHESHDSFLRSVGATPMLRKTPEGTVYMTDNGNYIYDCRFAGIDDPAGLSAALRDRAGIVEIGLFINIATVALIADETTVEKRVRQASSTGQPAGAR